MNTNKTYNHEIAAAINSFLTEDDWKYYFDEKRGVFRFNTVIKSKMKMVEYIIRVESHYYTVFANYPLGVDMEDEDMVNRMCQFMARANDGMIRGCMTMDFDDGELSFQVYPGKSECSTYCGDCQA